ncbi:MAG: response regulator [Oligoflexales bacterium]
MMEKIYTITLDDDPLVYKIIQKSTQVTSLPFSSLEGLCKKSSMLQPLGCFIDVHLSGNTKGYDVIPDLRKRWPYVPLLVMTASDDVEILSHSLGLGADDFLKKPLNPLEIRTRFQIRAKELEEKKKKNLVKLFDITLDVSRRTIFSQSQSQPLSPMSVNLLEALMQAKGMLVDRDFLRKKLWGINHVTDNNLDRQVSSLRRILADSGSRVVLNSQRNKGLYLSIEEGVG